MNSSILQSLTNLARVPDTDPGNWLENAEQSVRFLTGTSKNAIFAHRWFRIGLTIC